VLKTFGGGTKVVFDGYEDCENSTKALEQAKRAKKHKISEIQFENDMIMCQNQENFLASTANKQRFISKLIPVLQNTGIVCFQAEGDADGLLINEALKENSAVVVSEDTDVITGLICLLETQDIFIMRNGIFYLLILIISGIFNFF